MTVRSIAQLAALVFFAVTSIVIGDTAGKLLTRSGVDPVLVAWLRFVMGALILLPIALPKREELRFFFKPLILLRGGCIALGIFCILTALKTEPIANVFGAFFIGPIVSYALAVVFLKETLSAQRLALLLVGFVGVMLVVKPGFGMSQGMGFALAAGCCYGIFLTMTRKVAGAFRPGFLLMSQLLIGAAVLAPFGVGAAVPELSLGLGGLIVLSAIGSALGNFLLVLANRQAQASVIAPLIYLQLFSATAVGVLVFGDWPDSLALLGLAMIAGSGLFSLVGLRAPAAAR